MDLPRILKLKWKPLEFWIYFYTIRRGCYTDYKSF